MRIRNNIPGMRSLRYGKKLNNETSKMLEKLSSGYSINRAGDNAAGLTVSERIRVNLTGYDRCKDNVQEGMDLANTADAALQEVNDMLRRSKELCVTAANGTYSDQERDQLLDELHALYDEMDRIFESSSFNETRLFRHEDGDYSNGRFEYLEEVITTPDLQEWGALGDIDQLFGFAEQAAGATVTLELDSDVQAVTDLVGKSFTVEARDGSSYNVNFTTGTTTGGEYSWDISIGIGDCQSVQDAFDKLCAATAKSTYWKNDGIAMESASVDMGKGEVTLTFLAGDMKQTVAGSTYEVEGGDGEMANGAEIKSVQDESLEPVDAGENIFSATASFNLLPGRGADEVLTDAEKTYLRNNAFYVKSHGITFKSGTSGDRVIDLDTITTVKDLRDAVTTAIGTIDDISVSATADGTVTVKDSDYTGHMIYESTSSSADYAYIPTTALSGIGVTVMRPAGAEQTEITVITLPDSFPSDPFSISVNGATYCFYDSSALQPGYTTYSSYYDMNGKTPAEIQEKILSCVRSQYSSDAVVSPNGNEIIVTAKSVNEELNVSVSGVDASIYTYYKSEHVLLGNDDGSYYKYYQDYSVELDIGSTMGGNEANVDALDGTGFKLNGTWYQFVTDPDSELFTDQTNNKDAVAVDISGCDTYQEIADTLAAEITGSTVSVADGVLTVSGTHKNSSSYALNFQDGYSNGKDGLFNETPGTTSTATVSGGTKVGQPSAVIDFSRYNADNFRELYGKGFRVTCATCEDEFFNVIFCYDEAQSSFPPSFEITSASGETRTIHNMVVELKGMTGGSDIVQNIVTQLGPKLDHYTGIRVGTPSSVLEVFDKRRGDLTDVNGQPLRAEVKSGVYTNCIYTVEETFIPAPDDVVGDVEIDYRCVDIFANAEGGEQYIEIHLPYLTLENLKLDPPKPDFSTPAKVIETMERILEANNAISSMRGRLGADYNRLEHAYENLAQAETQAADAYSRIRDTDMAEMMTERAKMSILQNAQQAAQAHTLEMPKQVLELLR